MSIDYRAVFGRSEIFSFGCIGFLLPHRSSFGAAKSAGLPTDSCFTGALARSFSLPVLYRRKHGWKYCLNAITKQIGTAAYVVSITEAWITPTTLLVISFLVCSIISFLTGTSWGTIAIMVPIIAPLALSVSGGELSTVVYAAVATILGGATFGDHCSPISDTSILSSLAAGSDHIAHVKTQLPYALTCAAIGCIGYLIIGLTL